MESSDNFLKPPPRGPTFKTKPRPRSITSPPRAARPKSITSPPRPRTRPPPRPPIPTYKWEEIRRSKAKGGYPWTYLRLWQGRMDHEYEVVMPPPPSVRVTGPTYDRYEPELGNAPRREGSNSSTESRERKERKFLRIPLDDEMVGLPADGEGSEDEALGVEEKEEVARMDDRAAIAPSPGTTSGSRTDLELNTSQVDSSALEDLPLSRSARRQQRLEQQAEDRGPGAASRSLQRIRSQAGKLRTKLRNIKRPNINMPDRPRFTMPERPKFNFPERPKFSMPERPKFNFPERPKFNLPARPKFNIERPKFNFPSFSLPRSRRPLQERQEGSLDVPAEQNVHQDTPQPPTPGKRNYFDFRTYPRIFDRKSRQHAPTRSRPRPITPPVMRYGDDDEEEMEIEDDEPVRKPTLPPRRRSSGGQQPTSQRWVGKFTELEYADSENLGPLPRTNGVPVPFDDEDDDEEIRALERELHAGDTEEEHSESLSGFRDKDFGYAVSLGPPAIATLAAPPPMIDPDDEEVSLQESEREVAHSSGSSSDRRRAGVLEEIDSDEFFLREKGLSQEDVDVGRYLSSEIREAFRPAPETAALLLENATLNEAELARSYRGTPERGTKTRPPRRARAAKQLQTRVSTPPPPPQQQQEEEMKDTQHYFNTFPPNKPTRNRRRQMLKEERQHRKDYATATVGRPAFPTAPRRKKRTRSEFVLGDNTSQWSEDLNPEWIKTVESQVVTNEVGVGVMVAMMRSDPAVEHEYIIPEAPAAPKRGRRQARLIQQQPEDDARSHLSEPQEEPGYASVVKPTMVEIEIVDKVHPQDETILPPCTPPPRRLKPAPPRPPFPSIRRRRNRPLSGSGTQHFFTVPHRRGPPTRPTRNYATLGPSRPPRRHRRASLEDIHDSSRNLQSGAVIQKMKERPLPPPPRPPRRDRVGDDIDNELPIESETAVVIPEVLTSSVILDDNRHDDIQESENVGQHTMKLSASSEIIHVHHEIPKDEDPPLSETDIMSKEIEQELELKTEVQTGEFETKEEITTCESKPVEKEPQPVAYVIERIESIEDPVICLESLQEALTPEDTTVSIHQVITSDECKVLSDVMECSEAGTQSIPEETFVAVEEVNVSTQTDPLPEEELLRLEMEQEEAMCGPSEPMCIPPQVPAEVPVQPEMSSATAAILQALNSGQLRLELLDVARLNVNELQAQRLLVSDIEGMSLNVSELQSQGGALVLSAIDAPMNSLAEAIVNAARQMMPPPPPLPLVQHIPEPIPSTSTATQCDPPDPEPNVILKSDIDTEPVIQQRNIETESIVVSQSSSGIQDTSSDSQKPEEKTISISSITESKATPISSASDPLPHQQEVAPAVQASTSSSSPGPQFYQSLSPVFTTEQVVALQAAALSNAAASREVSPQPPRRSSIADVWQPALQQQPPRYQEAEQDGIIELGTRLARACYSATLGALRRVVNYSEQQISSSAEEVRERGSLQVALCIVLVLVAGIILIGLGGGAGGEVHHHHWDFYMPK
ncbi:hypothetical protein B566_EDAN000929 [Ephemera danica]|nr:hypothetical protein B566_EDAN000929 [Ephemera danica]